MSDSNLVANNDKDSLRTLIADKIARHHDNGYSFAAEMTQIGIPIFPKALRGIYGHAPDTQDDFLRDADSIIELFIRKCLLQEVDMSRTTNDRP